MAPQRALGTRLPLALLGVILAVRPSAGQDAGLRFDVPPLPLGQPVVEALFQDRAGFVWVGTQGGLVRFDGHTTVEFSGARHARHHLPSSAIRDLLEDARGRLWVTTLNGVAILSPDRRSVTEVTAENHPELMAIGDAFSPLGLLPDGRVAAGMDAGGFAVFAEDGSLEDVVAHDPSDPDSPPPGPVDDLISGPDGTFWLATRIGLYRRPPGAAGFVKVDLPPPAPGMGEDEPRRLALNADGTLWVGGLNGIVLVDTGGTVVRTTRLGPYRVQSLLPISADSTWVGTYGNGLYLLDREGRVQRTAAPAPGRPQALTDGRVSALLRDRGGLLWVGTWGSGVQTADPAGATFRFLPTGPDLVGEEVTSIHPHPDGRDLLVTTYGGGVNILGSDGRLRRTIDAGRYGTVNEPAEVLTANWPRDGDLLVGTMRVGVQRILRDGSRRNYAPDAADPFAVPDGAVYAIETDTTGRIWVGTSLGLRRLDLESGRFDEPRTSAEGAGLESAPVRVIHPGGDGRLWIGTLGDGLFIFDPETGDTRHIDTRDDPEIPDDEISAVTTLGPYGWFGTRTSGTLHRVVGWESEETMRIEQVGPADGLGGAVQCLVADRRGRLWGSTTSEILGVDPGSLQISIYGAADGVPVGEFRSASCGLGPDGAVWFGKQTGVTFFHPDSLHRPTFEAATVVSAARFDTTEIVGPVPGEVRRIPWRGGLINFRLAVLEYRSPESQSFSYRLNDGPWTSLGSEASITFVDLAPGQYTLEARGRDAHGFLAATSAPVRFDVLPPFQRTLWFRAIVVLLLTALVVGLFQWRTRTIRRHNAELRREIEERKRLEEAGALLEEQLRQSQKMEAVGRLTGGIAHDFNNILTVLMGNAELLLEAEHDDSVEWRPVVMEIQRAGEVAANLVRQLLVYARRQPLTPTLTDLTVLLRRMEPLLRRSIGAHYDVVVDIEDGQAPVVLDANQLESAILNLAINARDAMPDGGHFRLGLRHLTPGSPLDPTVPHGDWWVVTVSDTGSGIPEALQDRIFEPFFTTKGVGEGSGLGLAMVYGFVEQSGGHVRVESREGEGSRFHLYLPAAQP